jgi:hypothetical protein
LQHAKAKYIEDGLILFGDHLWTIHGLWSGHCHIYHLPFGCLKVIYFDFVAYNLICRVISKEVRASASVDVSMNAKLELVLEATFYLQYYEILC